MAELARNKEAMKRENQMENKIDKNSNRSAFRKHLASYENSIIAQNISIQGMPSSLVIGNNDDLMYRVTIFKRECVDTDRAEEIIFVLLGGVFEHYEIAQFNLYLAFRSEMALPSPTAFIMAGN